MTDEPKKHPVLVLRDLLGLSFEEIRQRTIAFVKESREFEAAVIPELTDGELDAIYAKVEHMMRADQLAELDAYVAAIPVSTSPVDTLLGVLTASLPVRSKLPSRARFVECVAAELKKRGEAVGELLDGLR